jgi:hypothetical protein
MGFSSTVGVQLPEYQLVAGPLLHALEHASSVTQVSDEAGEAFLIFAEVLAVAAVPSDSILAIPLIPPEVEEAQNFSYQARSKAVFVQLHEKPKQFMTYGHCLGYSVGTVDPPLAIDEIFKFPSMATYIVTKARLSTTIFRASVGPAVDLQLGPGGSKRQCARLPGYVGELAEDAGDKTKGTSLA